jgi:mitogen-activated protein kinase 1/3
MLQWYTLSLALQNTCCNWLLQVALKRIPDVLLNSENAKRVLREVCILRRLEHPHIIGLKDVFLKPSSTGGRSLQR